ncbi:MAG: OpgC family protein [Acetobacteraceae bacterium]
MIRSGRRDLRVDFFRGLALWWIYTDHIPGDVLGLVSLHSVALCDAAEVFVLLAGFGAGKAYASIMDRDGYFYGAAEAVKRAWTLYIAHIFLFVVYAAQVSYGAISLDRVNYLDESRLNVLADQPYQALMQALTLRYQPSLLNILPLYVVLLLIFALALPLLRRPRLLAGLSFLLYAGARAAHVNFPSWTGGGWFFNPLTWQFLFIIGAILAYAPPRHVVVPRVLDWLAGATVLGGLAVIFGLWRHPALATVLPYRVSHALLSVDKTNLDPARLASIMALVWLTVRLVPAGARWLESRAASPFVLMGQHSLPVFCFSIFIGFFGRLGLEWGEGVPMQLVVNLGGLLAMIAVATVAAWYRRGGQTRTRSAPSVSPRATPLPAAAANVTKEAHGSARVFGADRTAPGTAARGLGRVAALAADRLPRNE